MSATSSTRSSFLTSLYRSRKSQRLPNASIRFASSSQPSTPSASISTPTHYLITLHRSSIGLPSTSRDTLAALGLHHKLHRSVLHPFSPTTAGQILRVKELVQVVNVTQEEGERIMMDKIKGRREGSGWDVVGRKVAGGRLEKIEAPGTGRFV